ncbi:hypothetical protein DFH27DRAFT_478856 [Peziza echinospora]|nr:hypothetical protein DFH27DRAFT_478856 [Peziza echinospora]
MARVTEGQEQYYNFCYYPYGFNVGDLVYILLKNHLVGLIAINTLDDGKRGPFPVIEMVGLHVAKVDLPPMSKVHNILSVQHLLPFIEDDTYGWKCHPPALGRLEGKELFEVDHIFGE